MILPTHLWIGFAMVAGAIAGFLLLMLEHFGLWAMKDCSRNRNCNLWAYPTRMFGMVFLAYDGLQRGITKTSS
jgi:H+/Cl- antiporter ClcA